MGRSPPRMTKADRRGGPPLGPDAYRTLADFRYLLRRFLDFSVEAARSAALTPRQHQALLQIKGFSGGALPSVGDLAQRLIVQHHSAVELVDRLAEAGLIVRVPHAHDRRRVLLRLTEAAEDRLAELAAAHLEEIRRLRPALLEILERVEGDAGPDFVAGATGEYTKRA